MDVRVEVTSAGGHSSLPPEHTVSHTCHPFHHLIPHTEHWSSCPRYLNDRSESTRTPTLAQRDSIHDCPVSSGVLAAVPGFIAPPRTQSCHRRFRSIQVDSCTGESVSIDEGHDDNHTSCRYHRGWGQSKRPPRTSIRHHKPPHCGAQVRCPQATYRMADTVHSSVAELQQHIIGVLSPVAALHDLTLKAFGRTISTGSSGEMVLSDAFDSALEPSPVTPAEYGPYSILGGTVKATMMTSTQYNATEVIVVPSLLRGRPLLFIAPSRADHIPRTANSGE